MNFIFGIFCQKFLFLADSAKNDRFWHHFWRFINGFMLSFCPISPFLTAKTAIFKTYYVPTFFNYPAHQIFTHPAPLLHGTLFFSFFYLFCFHKLWTDCAFPHATGPSFFLLFFLFCCTAPSGAHRVESGRYSRFCQRTACPVPLRLRDVPLRYSTASCAIASAVRPTNIKVTDCGFGPSSVPSASVFFTGVFFGFFFFFPCSLALTLRESPYKS